MRYYCAIILILLSVCQLHAQEAPQSADTLMLYFNTDSFELTDAHKRQLDHKMLEYSENSCSTVYVEFNGYTDEEGSEEYNIDLAKNRLLSVQNEISKSNLFVIRKNTPWAERGKRMPSKRQNRRVEIIFKCQFSSTSSKQDSEDSETAEESIIEEIKSYKDSTITFESGLEVNIHKEIVAALDTGDLFSKFEIKDLSLTNPTVISGYTQDENGNPLASAGMFEVLIQNRLGEDTCINPPMIFRLPVRNDGCYNSALMLPWEMNENGRWTETNDFNIDTVTVDGIEYFETQIFCSGKKNLDTKLSKFKLRLKVKGIASQYSLDSAIVTNECKSIKLRAISKNGKRMKVTVPCDFTGLNIQYYFHYNDIGAVCKSELIKIEKHKKGLGYRFCKVQSLRTSRFRRQLIWPRLSTYSIGFNKLKLL